jgi:hypothetical protein
MTHIIDIHQCGRPCQIISKARLYDVLERGRDLLQIWILQSCDVLLWKIEILETKFECFDVLGNCFDVAELFLAFLSTKCAIL